MNAMQDCIFHRNSLKSLGNCVPPRNRNHKFLKYSGLPIERERSRNLFTLWLPCSIIYCNVNARAPNEIPCPAVCVSLSLYLLVHWIDKNSDTRKSYTWARAEGGCESKREMTRSGYYLWAYRINECNRLDV